MRTSVGHIPFGRLLLAMMLALAAWPLQAKRDAHGNEPDTFDFDESLVQKWKESEVAVPAYPQDGDLLPLPMHVTDTLKVYIDRKSISRAPDLVARFTLVVESRSGARSVFYEGLRCETRQYKTYAIGTPDRVLAPARNPQWRSVPRTEINSFRDYLYRDYACDKHDSARSPDEIIHLLKYQP